MNQPRHNSFLGGAEIGAMIGMETSDEMGRYRKGGEYEEDVREQNE
jgi:hypothetical protein